MTNDLGHRLAQSVGDQMTLGAYRLGNRLPWAPGALIDIWAPCPRGEVSTGVPAPHVYFMRTRGDHTIDRGSIYCPECRIELAENRAAGPHLKAPAPQPLKAPPAPQGGLPF